MKGDNNNYREKKMKAGFCSGASGAEREPA